MWVGLCNINRVPQDRARTYLLAAPYYKAMSLLSVRKKGYLYKLPVKGLVKKWNRRWFVLFATTHEGVVRIEYYDNESNEVAQMGKRTIPLRDSIGLVQIPGNKTQPFMFEFTSQIGRHVFATDTLTDLEEWIRTIKEVVKEDRMRMRRKKTQSLVVNRPLANAQEEEEERTLENSLYESSGVTASGTYRVTLEKNETSEKLNLNGAYNLEITPSNISLIAANSGATIVIWEYKHLKTYGKASGRFNIETGSSSPTGKGSFIFITTCSKEIFGVVHRNIKKLRQQKERELAEKNQKDVSTFRRQMSDTSESDRHFQEVALLRKNRSASAAPTQHSHSAATNSRSRPHSNLSTKEPPGGGVAGTYRHSTDLEERNQVAPDQFDPSHIYAEVKKPKKKTASNPQASEPPPGSDDSGVDSIPSPQLQVQPPSPWSTDPFAATASPPPATAVGRLSFGSSRESRDSTFIDQFDGSFTNPLSVEEDLPPLTSGVENPLGNMSAMGQFNIEEFDDNIFQTLEELQLQDKLPETQSEPKQQQPTGDIPILPPPPQFKGTTSGASRPRGKQPERSLSQKEFDAIWDNICSNMPESDN